MRGKLSWKNMYHNYGKALQIRPVEKGLSEMTCELCIPEEILRSTIAYKYLVYSSKAQGKNDWYEFIQTQYGTDPNRALCIPRDSLAKCQGI